LFVSGIGFSSLASQISNESVIYFTLDQKLAN